MLCSGKNLPNMSASDCRYNSDNHKKQTLSQPGWLHACTRLPFFARLTRWVGVVPSCVDEVDTVVIVLVSVEVAFVEVGCFFLVVARAVLVVAPNVTGEETDVAEWVPVEVEDELLDDRASDAGDGDTDGLGWYKWGGEDCFTWIASWISSSLGPIFRRDAALLISAMIWPERCDIVITCGCPCFLSLSLSTPRSPVSSALEAGRYSPRRRLSNDGLGTISSTKVLVGTKKFRRRIGQTRPDVCRFITLRTVWRCPQISTPVDEDLCKSGK